MVVIAAAVAFVTATVGGLATVNLLGARDEAAAAAKHTKIMLDALLSIYQTLKAMDVPDTTVRFTLLEGRTVTGVIVGVEQVHKVVYLDTRKPGAPEAPKFGELLALAINEIQDIQCDAEIVYGEGA